MSDQTGDWVLTYWGFTFHEAGDVALGMNYNERALSKNPANILARSYMGQALVEAGDLDGTRSQLDAIIRYGGEGTWAGASLPKAIFYGKTYDY